LGDLSAAAAPSPTLLSSPGRALSSELVGRPAPAPEPAAAEDRGGQRDRIASAAALSGGRPPRISRALESAAPASGGGDADRHRARRSAARRGDLVAADVYRRKAGIGLPGASLRAHAAPFAFLSRHQGHDRLDLPHPVRRPLPAEPRHYRDHSAGHRGGDARRDSLRAGAYRPAPGGGRPCRLPHPLPPLPHLLTAGAPPLARPE